MNDYLISSNTESFDRIQVNILSVLIDNLTWESTLNRLLTWANNHDSKYVCMCNVHSVVTAGMNPTFCDAVLRSDLATSDGYPVVWLMRRLGFVKQERINGPDLMWKFCHLLSLLNGSDRLLVNAVSVPSIFFYGGSYETLVLLIDKLCNSFPALMVAGSYSPPFRLLTQDEDDDVIEMINSSGAGLVWVGLGCPKQEQWMAEHRGKIHAVMVGVGAAFDFHAGTIKRAPLWMQNLGLEWFYRLVSEPRRLWKRYLVTNTLFVIGAAKQLLFGSIRN